MREFGNTLDPIALAVAAILAIASVGGCSSVPTSSSQPAASQSFGARLSDLFGMSSLPPEGARPAPGTPDPVDDCPTVEVRHGASTLQVAGRGGEPSPTNLRYQATIGRTARECAISGATMTMRVGIEGRVILGPEGAPGQMEIPLRYALVQEGPEPKTIVTKLYRFPVTIAPGASNVPFTHVEEDLAFPLPNRRDIQAYVVYVGFDQLALRPQPSRRTKARASRD
jgi:hypothetical protein